MSTTDPLTLDSLRQLAELARQRSPYHALVIHRSDRFRLPPPSPPEHLPLYSGIRIQESEAVPPGKAVFTDEKGCSVAIVDFETGKVHALPPPKRDDFEPPPITWPPVELKWKMFRP